jgi:hypothetical protein
MIKRFFYYSKHSLNKKIPITYHSAFFIIKSSAEEQLRALVACHSRPEAAAAIPLQQK